MASSFWVAEAREEERLARAEFAEGAERNVEFLICDLRFAIGGEGVKPDADDADGPDRIMAGQDHIAGGFSVLVRLTAEALAFAIFDLRFAIGTAER